MTNAQLSEMRQALVTLRTCLDSLRAGNGATPHLLRLGIDLDRLQLDLDDMTGCGCPARDLTPRFTRDDIVYIADAHLAWPDADDEGIGGHRR